MNFVISVFALTSTKGYLVPRFNFQYLERDTGETWYISGGGTRAYLIRQTDRPVNEEEIGSESADSHFMVQRVVGALLVSGAGLFERKAVGRIVLREVGDDVNWTTLMDIDPLHKGFQKEISKLFSESRFNSWVVFLCQHTFIRRAIDDLYLGLVIPVEAFVFFYRGFEWIKVHQKIGWDDVAKDLRTTRSNMNDLKKLANVETGIRHASSTGRKARADVSTYGTWAAGLLDALEGARKRVEPKYRRRSSKRVAEIITAAVSTIPYP